jgi:hypothetical protein
MGLRGNAFGHRSPCAKRPNHVGRQMLSFRSSVPRHRSPKDSTMIPLVIVLCRQSPTAFRSFSGFTGPRGVPGDVASPGRLPPVRRRALAYHSLLGRSVIVGKPYVAGEKTHDARTQSCGISSTGAPVAGGTETGSHARARSRDSSHGTAPSRPHAPEPRAQAARTRTWASPPTAVAAYEQKRSRRAANGYART